jgi:predicted amidophosphoribosyltransferase
MAVAINPKRVVGNWISGYALDIHTVSSVHVGINEFGHDVFDTKRSELGELLYQLKYNGDLSAAEPIIEAAAAFVKPSRAKFDLIVPVPPSGVRRVQPVIILAKGMGEALNLPVIECVTVTRPATQLKGVMDREKRQELLEGLHAVDRACTKGKSILLFDDLYRSGATMNAVTDLLMREGKAAGVRVLTVTKTRSIQ